MTSRRRWTKEELYIALRIYCELPFGQFHSKNARVIQVAERLGRTPSAVAMKLCNFASLDPNITESGRRGLQGASVLDREVWLAISADWQTFLDVSEPLLEQASLNIEVDNRDTGEYEASTQVRKNQVFFRKAVLSSYDERCCITGLNEPCFLVASHIIPWRDKAYKNRRLDPKNGLCLSSLHDRAFDQGLLTLNEHLEVELSAQLLVLEGAFAEQSFAAFEGQQIILPNKFAPCAEALNYHRTHIFKA